MRSPYLPLRIGLAFSLLYPAINAWFNPDSWIGYIPPFALNLWMFDDPLLLHLFGAFEIALALWILSGCAIRIPSAIAGLILLFIVFTNLNQSEILFRDLSIAAIALFLAVRAGMKPV